MSDTLNRVKHLGPVDVAAPVSVIMTVLNEEVHLSRAVESVLNNGYAPGVELVIAVGPSTDHTAAIARRLGTDRRITVLDNPAGDTPTGLNLALAATNRDVIVRMDGHSVLPFGYISLAVEALRATGAANVGGRMVPDDVAPFPRAVAVAMKSRWGIGGAGHRIGGMSGPTESVFLGAFRRAAIMDVNGYDEHFARAQDWELNYRLRKAGYTVWFEPGMKVAYRPRGDAKSLRRQFFSSGQWRRELMDTHPTSGSLRYFAAPTVLIAIIAGFAFGFVGLVPGLAWMYLAWLLPLGYLAGILVASLSLAKAAGRPATNRMPLVLSTMHLAWGAGFLRGVR